MAPSMNVVNVVLLFLSIAGFYGTWVLLMNNGTGEHMAKLRDHGPHWLPGTQEPLRKVYTGIGAVDYQLTVLAVFFWEIVDGGMPNASLQAFHLAGQFGAAWTVVVLEGLRTGNRGKMVSHIMLSGLLIQNFAYAVITPLYLILHLSTSPTATILTGSHLNINMTDLVAIPISVAIGYILPAVLLALPAPSVLTFDHKQILMAVWQVFPIWVHVLQRAISFLVSMVSNTQRKSSTFRAEASSEYICAVRYVYLFALILAGSTHISAITLATTSKLFPALFAAEYVGVFNPSKVFFPSTISMRTQMSSIGHGALLLLQYDGLIGSASLVLWASALFVRAYSKRRMFDWWLSFAAMVVLLTALVGPVGCVVALLWARDELVLSDSEVDVDKSTYIALSVQVE